MYTVRKERFQPTPIGLSRPAYNSVVWSFQLGLYYPWQIMSRIVFSRKRRIELRLSDLDPAHKYLVASNHQSMIDPFVICGELPLPLLRRLGPFRYFAHAGLFAQPALRYLLYCFGGFPTRPFSDWPYGVEAARSYLGRKQTVVIFPEGKRTVPGGAPARDGVGILAADPSVRIIPVHLEWTRGRLRRHYRICVGAPLGPTTAPNEILAAIYALPLPE